MGFGAVEIGYGLSPGALEYFSSPGCKIKVSSLHAYTPAIEGKGGHPEIFSVSDPKEENRLKAVEALAENLELAVKCSAPVVILHAGRVREAHPLWLRHARRIESDSASGFFFRRNLDALLKKRASLVPGHLNSLKRSLSEILPAFEREGVRLAIENLPSYDAIPLPEEALLLEREFSASSAFSLWLDTGHAQVMENASFGTLASLAKDHQEYISGLHIHDVIGPMGDHKAPGSGGIDFSALSFLAGRILVFEPSPAVPRRDLEASLSFMKGLWGNDGRTGQG